MTKSNHTILTIFILVIITLGVIFAYTNLSPPNNLNANNNQNNTPPNTEPPFDFVSARASNQDWMYFENNFGGDENDEIKKVYQLDFYYIIGNTQSKTHYMQKNKQNNNIFVIKLTRAGSVMSVSLPTAINECEFIDCHATSEGIYILAKEIAKQNTILFFYSYLSQEIAEITTLKDHNPLSLTKSDNIIIATTKNNQLSVVFYNEQSKTFNTNSHNIIPQKILLTASYKNGVLIFVNASNNFYALHISPHSTEIILSVDGFYLSHFNINSFGYLFLLENQTKIYTIFCDNTFKILTTNNASRSIKNSAMLFGQSANYLVSVNHTNTINVLILSSRGDLVFDINLPYVAREIFLIKQDGNYFQIYAKGADGNLKIITLTNITNEVSKVVVPINNLSGLLSVERDVDNNFILFGNFIGTNKALNHNFGKQDVFMVKLLKLY